MRVAALYDIHGNLPALEAVVAEIEREGGVEEIIVGGDVLWGPMQGECIRLLRDLNATFVSGNCERDVLHPTSDVDRWCSSQLTDEERSLVASWPLTFELDVDGLGAVLFCHATPDDNEAILTRITPADSVVAAFVGRTAAVCICGHTHVQYDRSVPGAPRLVNSGSVGLPYEGAPGAYWASLGPAVELRRTEYDVERAIVELRATNIPGFDEIFGRALRGFVAASEATTAFESKRGA